ncbi:DUF502 domain-containing protein [Parvularcula sp. ZS-1/3]|uniref:DUF502 domain-containing protein n=1 Tax=Parvularcula mediterranea TaxID=2732508 RepID=A0A7Y3W4F0_9PROT|nr:DUF502 domain-containing protein [Parvularcula mediterranea]NNU15171.1 DUF502 domain-containing protein [Parvularcula mediterranea]
MAKKERVDRKKTGDQGLAIGKPGPLAGLRNSFFAGVVIAAPLLITAGVVYWAITGPLAQVDGTVQEYIPDAWLPAEWNDLYVPGFGILVTIVLLTLLGMFAKNVIGRFFIRLGESVVDSTPLVRNLYGFFKNVFEMALQQSEQSFKEVAMIEYPRPGLWTLCFVVTSTKGETAHMLKDIGDDMTNVFVPTTPNPTSGFLLFVPRSKLRVLSMTVEDGAKMIFSAGLVAPEFIEEGMDGKPVDHSTTGGAFSFLKRKKTEEDPEIQEALEREVGAE